MKSSTKEKPGYNTRFYVYLCNISIYKYTIDYIVYMTETFQYNICMFLCNGLHVYYFELYVLVIFILLVFLIALHVLHKHMLSASGPSIDDPTISDPRLELVVSACFFLFSICFTIFSKICSFISFLCYLVNI